VELTRGNITESLHFGAAAVVDSGGRLLAGLGNPEAVTFLRSTAKPLQAITLVEDGGIDHFGFTDEEVSLMCASHCGTDHHASVAASIQAKAGVGEGDLLCGIHNPLDRQTYKAMILRGEQSTANRHQCSGKHSGMLANCVLHGFPTGDYIDPEHPLQRMVKEANAEMWEIDPDDIEMGIDGCSVPVFAVPLKNAALGFARLVDPHALPEKRRLACARITQAMTRHPKMVAGDGWFDTELMRAGHGTLVTKMGAEGFQSVGVFPGVSSPWPLGLGIALKIEDGDLRGKIASLVAVEVLRQLGVLSMQQLEALKRFYTRPIYNWRKLEIGEMRPVFELAYYGEGLKMSEVSHARAS
jgi:L-asparaginase II